MHGILYNLEHYLTSDCSTLYVFNISFYLLFYLYLFFYYYFFSDAGGNQSPNINDSRLSTLTNTTDISLNLPTSKNLHQNQIHNVNEAVKIKKKSFADVYKIDIDLDLDEVVIAPQVNSNPNNVISSNTNNFTNTNNDSNINNSNCFVHLSASRLKLLQDTTMIDTALDLDSLEESTSSSIGTHNSQIDLIKNKNNF